MLKKSLIYIITTILIVNLNSKVANAVPTEVTTSTYWINDIDNNEIIFNNLQISNKNLIANKEQENIKYKITNIAEHPLIVNKATLLELLQYSINNNLYNLENNVLLEEDIYTNINNELNLSAVFNNNSVNYAVINQLAAIKTVPSNLSVYSNTQSININRWQETTINALENVVILHWSKSKEWAFIKNSYYYGWIESKYLTVMEKSKWLEYLHLKDQANILVVTTPIYIIGNIKFNMGAVIPFKNINGKINAIIPNVDKNYNYILNYYPISQSDIQDNLIHKGYLDFTYNNIINNAFKYLDHHYAWGGIDGYGNYGVDCSSFIQNVYATFDINLPRNTSDQEKYSFGKNVSLNNLSASKKSDFLKNNAKLGDILFLNGHALIYLGQYKKSLYAIHSVHSLGNTKHKASNDNYLPLLINKNIVSNLDEIKVNGKSLLQDLTSITLLNTE